MSSSSPANKKDASFAIAIMAAGKGTRLKSKHPKVLHEVGGRPLLAHVIAAAGQVIPVADVYAIIGHALSRREVPRWQIPVRSPRHSGFRLVRSEPGFGLRGDSSNLPRLLRLGLRFTFPLEIERHCSADEILQGRLIDIIAFMDVDSAPDIPLEAGVE